MEIFDKITNTLTFLIKDCENISIDADAQEFIINMSNNTIKTALTYMEKIKLVNDRITMEIANELCSNISFCVLSKYIQLCLDAKLNEAICLIYDVYDKGYSVMDILDNLFAFIKLTNIIGEDQKYNIIQYICKYITIFNNIHEDEIELALFTNNIIDIL